MDLERTLLTRINTCLKGTKLYVCRVRPSHNYTLEQNRRNITHPYHIRMVETSGPSSLVSAHRNLRDLETRLIELGVVESGWVAAGYGGDQKVEERCLTNPI